MTDSTTAWPTGSAADALPDPDDEPVVPDAGVASTSTSSPTARSGGYAPTLSATPSRTWPLAGGGVPMSLPVSRLPAGMLTAAVLPTTSAWRDAGTRDSGPAALTRTVSRSAEVITWPAA